MTPSPLCENLIKSFETCRLRAYLPTPDDKPTIGWGATGPDIKLGAVWTQAQADARFHSDLDIFASGVSRWIAGKPTAQRQFDAMCSLAFNIGIGAFSSSSVLRFHKAGMFDDAADAFLLWTKQAGAPLAGLVARRKAERAMYLGVRL